MSRRRRAQKRDILPDPRYGDLVLSKFVNNLMIDGKRSVAEGIVYGAIALLEQRAQNVEIELDNDLRQKSYGLAVMHAAIDKVKPRLEVRARRVGGATYQVPMEVRGHRQQILALRWIIAAARQRAEYSMTERLAAEIMDIVQERGGSIKKRDDTHKMAEANRAFAHFRF